MQNVTVAINNRSLEHIRVKKFSIDLNFNQKFEPLFRRCSKNQIDEFLNMQCFAGFPRIKYQYNLIWLSH